MTDTMKSWVERQFSNFYNDVIKGRLKVINVEGIEENFIVPSECKSNWTPSTTSGASYTDGIDYNHRYTSNLIVGQNNKRLKMNIKDMPSYFRVFSYDSNGIYKGGGTGDYSLDTDGYLTFTAPNSTFAILLNIDYLNWDNIKVATVENFVGEEVTIPNLVLSAKTKSQIGYVPNVLQNTKWAVCGDSFTVGSGIEETIPSGMYTDFKPTYQYLIANRNDMTIQSLAMGGRTLAKPSSGSFNNTLADNYTTIASDVDYITIYLGINDSHHRPNATGSDGEDTTGEIPLGTINDDTVNTFYGAWNVILPWLITNRPNAKIGIIVSNGCETDEYRVATIECAKKWGIPYIDLNGDERTPVLVRSTNASIEQSVRNARTNAWKVSADNLHPNAQAHAYESTIIENFLRSL